MSIISETNLETLKNYVAQSTSINELQRRLGYSANSNVTKTIKSYCEEHGISLEHFTSTSNGKNSYTEETLFIKDSPASQKVLRNWYIKGNYTPYKCAICNLEPFWNGKELTLTLDHINGDNKDDRLENLRWICPNCDRQLDTFGSKNNHKERINKAQKYYCKNCGIEISYGAELCPKCYAISQRRVDRPTKEELRDILFENKGNFSQVGRIFEVTDNSIRKWCKSYGLPFHSNDYKEKLN